MASIKPLGDKVVVQLMEQEEKTASGIFLPDSAKKKPQEGKIVATGMVAIGVWRVARGVW